MERAAVWQCRIKRKVINRIIFWDIVRDSDLLTREVSN
jgi:hypothetical protein